MVEEALKTSGELKKTISYPVLLLIIVNSIIGSGMFFLPAIGAQISGPSSILAWIILSLVTLYTAACFAELAGMFPSAGGIEKTPLFCIGGADPAWDIQRQVECGDRRSIVLEKLPGFDNLQDGTDGH